MFVQPAHLGAEVHLRHRAQRRQRRADVGRIPGVEPVVRPVRCRMPGRASRHVAARRASSRPARGSAEHLLDDRLSRHPARYTRRRRAMIRFMRILLIVFAAAQLVLGLLLWLAPGFFYDEIGPYGAAQRPLHGATSPPCTSRSAPPRSWPCGARRWRVPVLALALIQYALHSLNHLIDIGESDPAWLGPANFVVAAADHRAARAGCCAARRGGAMRVFVAGASGAIGRPLVPKLVAAGHEVTGMTRSEAKRRGGARGRRARRRRRRVRRGRAARGGRARRAPEVVVHELTALPDRIDFRKKDLYDADQPRAHRGHPEPASTPRARPARAASCRQSIAFAYRMDGRAREDRGRPAARRRARRLRRAASARSTRWRRCVLGAEGLEGLVLRYGFFYGPGTLLRRATARSIADVRRRRMPIVGKGTGVFSFIHVDDAADATVAAVERGAPGVYNVTDDEPAPMSEWVPACRRGGRREAAAPGAGLAREARGRQGGGRPSRSSCAAPPTRRRSASSAGSRPTRAGAPASPSRSDDLDLGHAHARGRPDLPRADAERSDAGSGAHRRRHVQGAEPRPAPEAHGRALPQGLPA